MTSRKPFVKWVLDCIQLPLHQNLIYWPSPTVSLEWSLGAIWGAVSRAAVLILLQIKLNSQLPSCASVWVDKHQDPRCRGNTEHLSARQHGTCGLGKTGASPASRSLRRGALEDWILTSLDHKSLCITSQKRWRYLYWPGLGFLLQVINSSNYFSCMCEW